MKLLQNPPGIKKEFCFALEGEKETVYFAMYSQSDYNDWIDALTKNSKLDETEAPDRSDIEKKKKEGLLF